MTKSATKSRGGNPFETDLDRNPANFSALTPTHFLERAAAVFPDRTAVVHGKTRYTWRETDARCRRLASALARRGIGVGDTVSVIAPNVPATLEAHYGVPMLGAVLNTINTRLDARTIAYILDHGEAKLLLLDREYAPLAKEVFSLMKRSLPVVAIDDADIGGGNPGNIELGDIEYEDFLGQGDPGYDWAPPEDEWQAIALNYTSGTTGNPKGVVYHHRGAFLNAMNNAVAWNMDKHPVFLWVVPMFHCNGWCFTWTTTMLAGTHVCLRRPEAAPIFNAISDHKVTHFGGAPIILNMLVNADDSERRFFDHTVRVYTGGSPPPAALLAAMKKINIDVTHIYGLTETYGPAVICDWHGEWDNLSSDQQAQHKSRQGVPYHALTGLTVADPETLDPVPADGKTMGEVLFRGNLVMKGYFKEPEASAKAFKGGWFHSGDLAVRHPDGYIQLKDRSKDIIISGGENISSIEVENTLYSHPAVLEAAVVARPDEKWGETPCAFVTLKNGKEASAEEIIAFCREKLAHFKAPKTVIFGPLPKTSTGKIQKFVLRKEVEKLDKKADPATA